MKRLIVGAALLALAGGASADGWKSLGAHAWLDSKESSGATIEIDRDSVALKLKNVSGCNGGGGTLSAPSPGRDLNINGQPLKTIVYCRGNSLIIGPRTSAGMDYWARVIVSEKDFFINLAPQVDLHFESSKGRKNLDDAIDAPESI